MAEYIKKEAAINELMNDALGQVGYSREDAADCIRYMDAAEVVPVHHGRWALDEYARYFRCSACGAQFDDETDTYCNIMNGFAPNYCEDCGAKMDEPERELEDEG